MERYSYSAVTALGCGAGVRNSRCRLPSGDAVNLTDLGSARLKQPAYGLPKRVGGVSFFILFQKRVKQPLPAVPRFFYILASFLSFCFCFSFLLFTFFFLDALSCSPPIFSANFVLYPSLSSAIGDST
jgi:hypothetical protein